ncbi:hypothetical protein [Noviherbaspirillum humi]|uniref:hypothetical protein n=1 Tax=Noviherbaspirillum humi TaxID=1688639 RepID=UPI000B779850|nr:hypothetical protein [Noviherbaspirillum humi]
MNRFSTKLDTLMELGKITCPHCGLSVNDDRNFIFLTHALSVDEENEFEHRFPVRMADFKGGEAGDIPG